MKLFFITITSILITGCMNVDRKDEISYDSYGEAYDKANRECHENPKFANKSLADCLKTMDFEENFSPIDSATTESATTDSTANNSGSSAGDEYGE